jgi:hypothetical protein
MAQADLKQQIAAYGLQVIESIDLRPARDFDQFLFDSDYLALPRSEIYPGVVKVGGEIYEGFLNNTYEAAFVEAGLGSGKSTMASLLICAITHWVLGLPNPHAHFGLLPDKPIVIPCMGPRAGQVKDVVFASVRSFISGSPFFQRLIDTKLEWEEQTTGNVLILSATFTRKFGQEERPIVRILAGNSVETYPLGMNVFAAVVDELSKFRDSEDKSQAKDIFETLDQRRLSRFGEASHKGIVICIGTAGAEGDYVDRRLKQADADPKSYVHRGVTWEMKGRHRYKGGFFHFAKLDLGPKGVRFGCYDQWPPEEADNVVLHLADVPDVFRDVAQRDPVLFLRDFASVSSLALHPWDMNAQVVERLANLDREHPLYEGTLEFKDWFVGDLNVDDYYIHVDLGLNREGKGDAAGFCLGHCLGEKRIEIADIEGDEWAAHFEFRPIIQLDLIMRWTAGPTGEIRFSDVRSFIYALWERGFNISGTPLKWDSYGKPLSGHIRGGVSFDGWQSIDSIQLLADKGIHAQILSVDKSLAPWEDLKEALHDYRLDYYKHETDLPTGGKRDWFMWEYQHLELVRGRKVDHPENGSKDVADSVAAVIHRITEDHSRPMGGWV